jgi:predicted nucleic acid-binding protein
MSRYVVCAGTVLHLAEREIKIARGVNLLAPTLLRSQILSRLYQSAREGAITRKDANRHLNYMRSLRIRLLGDRVLQDTAWKIADELDWLDTLDAEYLALTQLQADAFITLDKTLARAAKKVVKVASINEIC